MLMRGIPLHVQNVLLIMAINVLHVAYYYLICTVILLIIIFIYIILNNYQI